MGTVTHGGDEINEMVEASILLDRVTTRWRLADGEPYPYILSCGIYWKIISSVT